MKYISEYRDEASARKLAGDIACEVTQPWTIMEVCGGQTHAIVRFGIDQLLPPSLTLVHGPGCPVCVTATEVIDKAIEIASLPDVLFATFGDMLRVPGTCEDLSMVKASGGDVRMVYSPMDALTLARANRDREVVFFAVGFETTAPAIAFTVAEAKRQNVGNFSVLVSHVRVPPAIEAILASPEARVQGFLAAGHVCTIMGASEYETLARKYHVPIVITGFEPLDILDGVRRCVLQLERGRAFVENAYARVVLSEGNRSAQAIMEEVFCVVDRRWRGLGEIPRSGLALSDVYAGFDAERRFGPVSSVAKTQNDCISGLVLQGIRKPNSCPAFGTRCTPEHPLGAPMVSAEGACAAYYRYRRFEEADHA